MKGYATLFLKIAVVLTATLGIHTGLVFGDVTIRISGVPEQLSFPLREGGNVLLTAAVKGGMVKSVWLATSSESKARYMLTPVGDGEYQANLADRLLGALLRASEGEREFRIFAETRDGTIASSLPVCYTVAKSARVPPRIFVHVRGKKKEILLKPALRALEDPALRARFSGSELWVFPDTLPHGRFGTESAKELYHFFPQDVREVEVQFDWEARRPFAEAWVVEKKWNFQGAKASNVFSLRVTDEIKEAWIKNGELELVCGQADAEETRIVLAAAPLRLELPGGRAEMTLVQRSSKEVPGSRGYLWVSIGDIMGNKVLLSITTASGQNLVDQVPLRMGEEVAFRVGEQEYRLKIEKIENLLVGDDFGIFVITPASPVIIDEAKEREKIERLIETIQKSNAVFILSGKDSTAAETADYLRKKYEFARDEVRTIDDFIGKVASRCWLTGQEYLVRLPDGAEVTAGRWLREQAQACNESEEAPQKAGEKL